MHSELEHSVNVIFMPIFLFDIVVKFSVSRAQFFLFYTNVIDLMVLLLIITKIVLGIHETTFNLIGSLKILKIH